MVCIAGGEKSVGLLHELNITRKEHLTPKAKYFYERATYFKRGARLATNIRLGNMVLLLNLEKWSQVWIELGIVFFESQVENTKMRARGRRYTLEDKVLALTLYKHSGASYRFMTKIFALPSRTTLTKLLNKISINPGFNEEMFTLLKSEVQNFQHPLDKVCILAFDEMSIQPSLAVNKKTGSIIGFEDFGFETSEKIANHAQVCFQQYFGVIALK